MSSQHALQVRHMTRRGSASRGVCIQGGLHLGRVWETPPSSTTRYGQEAGGTHPAGIHSYDPNISKYTGNCKLISVLSRFEAHR